MYVPETNFYEENLKKVGKELVLQTLLWEWKNVKATLPIIKECGYTGVQISPITPVKKQWDDNGRIKPYSKEWYDELENIGWSKFYQPTRFDTIGNEFGTLDDFKELAEECDKYDIKLIPDLVTRHTANEERNWLEPHRDVDPYLLSRPDFWMKKRRCDNYKDRWQVVNCCTDLPCLNYENEDLLNEVLIPFYKMVANYTPHFRLDQMKHYGTPEEGYHFFEKVFKDYPIGLHYGEGIHMTVEECRRYSKYMFVLLHEGEWWEGGSKAMRFFESHDNHRSDLFKTHMTDDERIYRWENLIKRFDMCLLYAHRDDKIIFCDEVKKANWKYRGL